MRKLLCCLVIPLLLIIGGCASGTGFVVKDNAVAYDVGAKLIGHRAGFEIAQANMAAAKDFMVAGDAFIKAVETGEVTDADALMKEAIARLTAEVAKNTNDPATIAEVAILADMFEFQGNLDVIDVTKFKEYLSQLKAFMEGYKMGVSLWDRITA